jgi:hypothetical protein
MHVAAGALGKVVARFRELPSLRPVISTRTPSSSNCRAVSKPMPLEPPVTMARRPLIPRSILPLPLP